MTPDATRGGSRLPFRLVAPALGSAMDVVATLASWRIGLGMLVVFLATCSAASAATAASPARVLDQLLLWVPLMLRGFVVNIAISFSTMLLGTALGLLLGYVRIMDVPYLRGPSWAVTHFFRNAPWLVLIFYFVYLIPYHITIAGWEIGFPAWLKVVIGLALPIMANVAEIFRGAVQSIPSNQWEAARSLAFTNRYIMAHIILPQCVKRMLPPWMNWYCIVTMDTVLASIVGVPDVLTMTQRALDALNNPELMLPFYTFVLLLFFFYCYPIAVWTKWMERRYNRASGRGTPA